MDWRDCLERPRSVIRPVVGFGYNVTGRADASATLMLISFTRNPLFRSVQFPLLFNVKMVLMFSPPSLKVLMSQATSPPLPMRS